MNTASGTHSDPTVPGFELTCTAPYTRKKNASLKPEVDLYNPADRGLQLENRKLLRYQGATHNINRWSGRGPLAGPLEAGNAFSVHRYLQTVESVPGSILYDRSFVPSRPDDLHRRSPVITAKIIVSWVLARYR